MNQFELPSQHCQSELYNNNYNSKNNADDCLLIFNESHNNGLDPEDDHIPSVQKITAIRN